MSVKNYHEVQEQLFSKLSEYLGEHGIDTSTNFSCISPEHEDKSPSCSLHPNGQIIHCFSCSLSSNIFHAANYLEDKPLVGIEFIEENLKYLANKYGIQVESEPLTEEQVYELDTYKAYRSTSDFARFNTSEIFKKAIDEREWTEAICQEYGVGCIPDYKLFRERLKAFGLTATFIDDVDLGRKDIFGEDKLIFTIRDEYGRPVGFAGRNLSYDGKKENGNKYVNQKHTGIKCNIYRKSTRLFGFDIVLKTFRNKKKIPPIYVFEGYADVVTAANLGIKNCVAVGGTAFTFEQVCLLREHGFYNIILCLDGDIQGQGRTAEILDSTLSGHKDLRISVVTLPAGSDPDEFLRQKGTTSFKKLKKWTAFEWRLAQFAEETGDEAICSSMIPLIINEPSYISQENMCKALAKHTGMSLKSIQMELSRLQNIREAEKARDKQNIVDRMISKIKRDPEQMEFILLEAQQSLFELSKQYDEDAYSESSCLSRIQTQKIYEESKDGSFSGYILGKDLKIFQEALCGEWKKDVWFCFAGRENSGKTSLLSKLAFSIAKEETNDAVVIYHSIDDTTEQLLSKFVCIAEGSRTLLLNEVIDPNYWAGSKDEDKTVFEKRANGYKTLEDMVKKGRLVIKDANDGKSIAFADKLIQYYKEKFPKRNIVYILDNFHKLHDFENLASKDERVRFKKISNIMKDLATRHHILVMATVEYNKFQAGQRGQNSNIGECLAGDTLIYDLQDRVYKRIDQIKAGTSILTLDSDRQRIVPKIINKVWYKGIRPIFKVKLRSGRFIRTTINHPFFAEKGWTKLSDLQVGSWVAVPRILPVTNDKESPLNENQARFLGLMAGGGSYSLGQTPSFINSTKEYIENILQIAKEEFNIDGKCSLYNGSIDISFSNKKNNRNPITEWLKTLGIYGQIKDRKEIPKGIFQSNLKVKANYIAGLFETDGSIQGSDKPRRISFVNISSHLVYGLQSLLLEFGILSQIHSYKDLFKLTIANNNIIKFNEFIPIQGYKKEELCVASRETRIINTGDFLPPCFTELLKESRKVDKNPVHYDSGYYASKPTINRAKAQEIIQEITTNHSELAKWAYSDIYWDCINSIEFEAKEAVWDLTVEGTHNFVANNIFCHNTGQIAYDANLIAHVYNEVHEIGPEKATHRHVDLIRGKPQILPMLELNIGKNKVSGFKNKLYFNFWPECSDFVGVDIKDAVMEAKELSKGKDTKEASDKSRYTELATQVKEKGQDMGRASHLFRDEKGYFPPWTWREEFLQE